MKVSLHSQVYRYRVCEHRGKDGPVDSMEDFYVLKGVDMGFSLVGLVMVLRVSLCAESGCHSL